MITERDIQAQIWQAMGRHAVLFRNNVGALVDKRSGHFVKFGLAKGSSDLIGWTRVKITQGMVGSTVAVFTAIEIKTKTGKPTEKQQHFIGRVKAAGGYAGVARSVKDAVGIIEKGVRDA